MSVNFSDGFFDNYSIGSSYYNTEDSEDYQEDDIFAPVENPYKIKKMHDSQSAYYKFMDAVVYRLTTNYFKDNGIDRTNFKDYPGIEVGGILKNFTIVKELKPLDKNPFYVWWIENHQHFHLGFDVREDWIKGDGIDFLESFINDKIVPFAKEYYQIIPETKITREQVLNEIEKIKTKNSGGRPIGSKNKKEEKVSFLPFHKIPEAEGKLNIDALIFALADIVWRFNGIIYSKAISQLLITDAQKKYVAALILKNSISIQNKYFSIGKINDTTLLFVKMQNRQGYYVSNGILMSSAKISEKTGIKKTTLIYRLKNMSVYDATKDWKQHKNVL
jgi:hypothetical protein